MKILTIILFLITLSMTVRSQDNNVGQFKYFFYSEIDVQNVKIKNIKEHISDATPLGYMPIFIVVTQDTIEITQSNFIHKPLRENKDVVSIGSGIINNVDYTDKGVYINLKSFEKVK